MPLQHECKTMQSGNPGVTEKTTKIEEPDGKLLSCSVNSGGKSPAGGVRVATRFGSLRQAWERKAVKYCVLVAIIATVIAVSGYLIHHYSRKTDDSTTGVPVLAAVAKPATDTATYKVYKLENGLTVLLISDNTKSGQPLVTSMNVGAGSSMEPWEIPGLAHFLEHMLFLGSKKYPKENGLSDYLTVNGGGMPNAITGDYYTNYYFPVNVDAAEQALDMFSQFFISPTLRVASAAREIKAVDAEYRLQLSDGYWRQHRLVQLMADPMAQWSRFSVGSVETLNKSDLHTHLRGFYEKYYIAQKMTLGVWSTDSIANMEKLVNTKFSAIPAGQSTPAFLPLDPFGPGHRGLQSRIKTLSGANLIYLYFPIKSLQQRQYRRDPTDFLLNLLSHEGNGTVLAELRRRDWANDFYTYDYLKSVSFSLKEVAIVLTEEGSQHTDDIIGMVFQYLRLMQVSGITKALWNDYQVGKELTFRFTEPIMHPLSDIRKFTVRLSDTQSPPDLLSPPSRSIWDPKVALAILNEMTPDNVLVVVGTPDAVKSSLYDDFFQFNYTLGMIPDNVKMQWKQDNDTVHFSIPPANPFLPSPSILLALTEWQPYASAPQLLLNSASKKLWWYPNHEFPNQPLVAISVSLYSTLDLAETDPVRFYTSMTLWSSMVTEALATELYSATLAGFTYSVSIQNFHLRVSLTGYADEKQLLLVLKTIMDRVLKTGVMDELRFNSKKEERIRSEGLFGYSDTAKTQAMNLFHLMLQKYNSALRPADVLSVLSTLTHSDIVSFVRSYTAQLVTVCLVHGSAGKDQAISLFKNITPMDSNAREMPLPFQESFSIPRQSEVVFRAQTLSPGNSNSAVYTVLEIGSECEMTMNAGIGRFGDACTPDSMQRAVRVQMMKPVFRDACFDQLRTQEQLGYLVDCGVLIYYGTYQLYAAVESDTHNVTYIETRIQAFLSSFATHLRQRLQDPGSWRQAWMALNNTLSAQAAAFSAVTPHLVFEILDFRFQFNINSQLLAQLENVTDPMSVVDFYEKLLSERRQVSCQVFSADKPAPLNSSTDDIITVDNVDAWRGNQTYAPVSRISYGV